MTEPTATAMNADAQAVSIKLPTWWPDQPEVWFCRVEAIFRQKKITSDSTKFDYVLGALDNDTVVRVLDIVRAPPTNTAYQTLKDRLVSSIALSDFERACNIIQGLQLGEDKPSALLDRMLAQYGTGNPDFLFRAHFLLKLPESIREHLHQDTDDLRLLAKKADHQWTLRKISVATVATPIDDDVSTVVRQAKQKTRKTSPPLPLIVSTTRSLGERRRSAVLRAHS